MACLRSLDIVLPGFYDGFGRTSGASVTYTTLDPPNAAATYTQSISRNGIIAGFYQPVGSERLHSFLISPSGTYTPDDVPNSYSTSVLAVNNLGLVTGGYVTYSGGGHEFARNRTGKIDAFDAETNPLGINDLNQLTGYHTDVNGTHGFVADLFGTMTLFDVSGASFTFGFWINKFNRTAGRPAPCALNFPMVLYIQICHYEVPSWNLFGTNERTGPTSASTA